MNNSINSILRKEQVRTNNISKFEILYWEGAGSCIVPSMNEIDYTEGISITAVKHCELITKNTTHKPTELSDSYWEEVITFKVDNYDLATMFVAFADDNYEKKTLVFVSQFFTKTGKLKPF